MPLTDTEIRNKLKEYGIKDIHFTKSRWREWIQNNEFDKFQKVEGKPNIQEVYKILESDKVIYTRAVKFDRYEIRLKHSNNYDVGVIVSFEKENLNVVTYYKETVKRRQKQ